MADEGLDAKTLSQRVERYSAKPICDGISIDKDNNIYLGDLAENAIGVIKPDRSYIRLAKVRSCPGLIPSALGRKASSTLWSINCTGRPP